MSPIRGAFLADPVFEAVDPVVERVSHRPAGFFAQSLNSLFPIGGFLGTRLARSESTMNVESQFSHAFGERSFPRLKDGLKHLDSQPSRFLLIPPVPSFAQNRRLLRSSRRNLGRWYEMNSKKVRSRRRFGQSRRAPRVDFSRARSQTLRIEDVATKAPELKSAPVDFEHGATRRLIEDAGDSRKSAVHSEGACLRT